MGMIERYKKKGGFLQLLNLLETTPQPKRDNFMNLIAKESPQWESELKSKMLTLDRIATWNTTYLMEFIPRIPPANVAMAIANLKPEQQTIILSSLSYGDKKKAEDQLKDHKASSAEVSTCQMKIINEIRSMVAAGQLKFEKFDPDMVIPENVEERLNSGTFISSLSAVHTDPEAGVSSEPPPAGLPGHISEELVQLRRKVLNLSQENQHLQQQNISMKDKLEQIKKIA